MSFLERPRLAMRIAASAFLQSTLLLAIFAGLLVPDALAGGLTVNFSGKVTGTLPGDAYPGNVQTNDTITNSFFAYNPAQATGNSTTGVYTFTGTAQSLSLDV